MKARGLAALLLVLALCVLWAVSSWNPLPRTSQSFDRGTNGLWLGHKWYTGRNVRTGELVSAADLVALRKTLTDQGILYAYVHVGPIQEDGGLEDAPGQTLRELRSAAPDLVLLAWVGARVEKIPLHTPEWRAAALTTLRALSEEGFDGVHLDIEPLSDFESGYLELLAEIRSEFGASYFISQATPRVGPFGVSLWPFGRSLWSRTFYRETMKRSDQTVLMAYDTKLSSTRAYVEFVRHQSDLMIEWACQISNHQLLIGIPSYEDVPLYSDPRVENVRTASLGVRAALELHPEVPECFRGVAVYANWVTDAQEWRDYRSHWISPGLAGNL